MARTGRRPGGAVSSAAVVALAALLVWLTPVSGVAQGDNPFKKEPTQPRSQPTPRPKPRPRAAPRVSRQPAPPPQPALLQPFVNLVGMEMIPVRIGSKVVYFSRYEVTQEQWQAVMGSNPSFPKGNDLPVNKVSLDDVAVFLRELNQLEHGRSLSYRLPTSGEWEAAALGDGTFNLDAQSWYARNSGGRPQPVGRKQPNSLGLYDMSGNVWEWCAEGVVRGGAYDSPPERCGPRSGYRESPQGRDGNIGFRVVASPLGR
ncbi:MAG: formylglycine-generating enzyme family protein [Chloracidobacterium sp.]|nr:formylglycine-generating enzyme family protein [Chloracidobacterium sp.]MDW8218522.1 formylglycine-generating enzyme family protein [Acidobacteriota bacterium]